MNIIWVCNYMLPAIAESLNKKIQNKEGWLTGLSEAILKNQSEGASLTVLFPQSKEEEPLRGILQDTNLRYESYPENSGLLHEYQPETEAVLVEIFERVKPDVIHVFGTEFPHALATIRAAERLGIEKKVLVGIQGYMLEYAPVYMAGIPKYVENRVTFRDWLKKDSIKQQKEKFEKRAEIEKALLQEVYHITGRTDFDHETTKYHEGVQYHFMNETLRSPFYFGKWSQENCESHRIFVSQGNYPIKGAHKAIEAFARITKEYPDAKLVIAGDKITAYETLKDKIKISSYGKYLRELVQKYHLEEKIEFTGSLNALQMKDEFLRANLFLSCAVIENSPNSMGEAMLLGMPVVASNVGGVSSMISKEEGYLYPYEDVSALTEAVKCVFDKPEEAAKKGENARQRAICTHNPQSNFKRLMEIYHIISEQ